MKPKAVVDAAKARDRHFEWRVKEPSRIEGLSDAVFGFSVTLLVISLEVPRTFDALMHEMTGLFSFGLGFFFLMMIWYKQFIWFRRYGLDDTLSVVLNAALLAVVVFYVYPLKFLGNVFAILFGLVSPTLQTGERVIHVEQMPQLVPFFGIGFLSVHTILFLLALHGWAKRGPIGPDELECIDTRFSLTEDLIMLGVGVLSLVMATVVGNAFLSGMSFMLLGPLQAVQGFRRGKARKLAIAASAQADN